MASLAARCTACGTVFRVVPDQLRVAGGLVRCGRCSEVFNAAESLIDLDALVPPVPAPVPVPAPPPAPTSLAEDPQALAPATAETVETVEVAPEAVAAFSTEPMAPAPDGSREESPDGSPEVSTDTVPEASPVPFDSFETPETAAAIPEALEAPAFDWAEHGAAPALADETPPEPVSGPEPGTDFELQLLPPTPTVDVAGAPEPEAAAFSLPPPRMLESPEPDLDFPPPPEPVEAALHNDHADPRPAPQAFELSLAAEDRPEPATDDPDGAARPVPVPPADDLRHTEAESPDVLLGGNLAGQTAPATAEEAPAATEAVPSFVRSADRAQRWRTPRMRAALGAGVALGLLLLAGQLVHTYRDVIAARHPQANTLLVQACNALGCRIEAPRLIDSLSVESSGLVRVEKSAVYKLQLALRNRDTLAVAMPALDVTLSDAQGKPLARRVLRMAELGVTDTTLAAGRELAVHATLQAAFQPASLTVAGYTIELFYP